MQRCHDDVVITLLTDVIPDNTEELYLSNAKRTPKLSRKHERKGKVLTPVPASSTGIQQVGVTWMVTVLNVLLLV